MWGLKGKKFVVGNEMMFHFSFPEIEFVWGMTSSTVSHENGGIRVEKKVIGGDNETEESGSYWENVVLHISTYSSFNNYKLGDSYPPIISYLYTCWGKNSWVSLVSTDFASQDSN